MVDIYDEAFKQMAQAPPEPGENLGPRPRGRPRGTTGIGWKDYTLKTPKSVRINSDIIPLIEGHAKARGVRFSDSVNALLAEALRNHEIDPDNGEVY